jgi:hypothetical protein
MLRSFTLALHLVGKTERQQEYGDSGDFREDFGNPKLRDPMAPDVMAQTGLGELRIFGLDGFKEAAPSLNPLTFDPLPKIVHGIPQKTQAETEKNLIPGRCRETLSSMAYLVALPLPRFPQRVWGKITIGRD